MLKFLIGIISLLVLLLLFNLTNPGTKRHKFIVDQRAPCLLDETLTTIADSTSSTALRNRLTGRPGAQLRKAVLADLLKNGISRTNYILFSTTNLNYKGQQAIIGYGLLANVYLKANADSLLRRIATESIR